MLYLVIHHQKFFESEDGKQLYKDIKKQFSNAKELQNNIKMSKIKNSNADW